MARGKTSTRIENWIKAILIVALAVSSIAITLLVRDSSIGGTNIFLLGSFVAIVAGALIYKILLPTFTPEEPESIIREPEE